MTRHERQIPRGGKAEGRMHFRRGRVLPVRRAVLPHCGITAKNALFFGGGGLIASVRRAARRVNLIRVGSFRTHTVRPSGLAFHRRPLRALLGRAALRRGRRVGRGVPPSRLPANRTIHPPASSGGCGAYSLFTCTPLSFRAGSVAVRTTGARGKGIAAG